METPTQSINFKDNNRKPRGKRSAPKAEERQTGKPEPYAYTFKDSAGTLPVLNSANAWWLDSAKLAKLVDAYKFYATDDQACFYAGISITQLKYFQELHPDFYAIKHACKQDPNLRAKKTIVGSLEKDKEIARWWLERTEKDTFSARVESTGANGRDLYDGMTQQFKELTESIIEQHGDADIEEKHNGEPVAGNVDAGSNGAGDEAAPAEPVSDASATAA